MTACVILEQCFGVIDLFDHLLFVSIFVYLFIIDDEVIITI